MNENIDERIVQMRFDNRQFEKNAQTSIQTLESLKKSLDLTGVAKGFETIVRTSEKVNFSGLNNAVESVRERFSALEVMAVTALANITNTAVNAGKRILQSLTVAPVAEGFSEYELKMGSIQTMMMSTGESLETVNKYLDELNVYADKTIYSFSDMTSNIGKFTNAGVKLKDAVKAIQGISNVAAVSGANSQQASHAMYNFAQALSSGSVKLIDWKSIENAQMATVEFKNQLLATALELGTVVKQGDRYITTTTNLNGKTSEAFDATHLFNDSLGHQWMTTEVLVKTLNRYSDETTEIGKKAFAAAQDVKTFTQLMDTLKEAVGSGWATTWETIFGDFNEAKKLWTSVSNVVGGFIDQQSKARNELLKGWKELGGREAVITAASNAFDGLKAIVVSLKETFIEFFPAIRPEQLVNLSKALKDLTEKFKMSKQTSENLKNSFRGLFAIIDIMRSLFGSIFRSIKPLIPSIGAKSGGLVGSVLEITGAIGVWLSNLDKIIKKHDIFYNSIQLAVQYIKRGIEYVKQFGKTIRTQMNLPQLDSIQQKFSDFIEFLRNKIGEFGKFSLNGIESLGKRISGAFNKDIDTAGLDTVNKKLSYTERFAKNVSVAITNLKNHLLNTLNSIKEYASHSKIFNFLQALWNFASKVAVGIGNMIGSTLTNITKKLEHADFDTFLDFINTLSIGGIAIAIKKFLEAISGSVGGLTTQIGSFKKIIGGITGVLKGIQNCLEAYQTQLKANVLLKIAFAIGILAASAVALSLVDSRKLQSALGAITVMFADLMGSLAIYGKVSGKLDKTNKTIILMIGLSSAILILASACKKLAKLDMKELGVGLSGITALLFELTSFTSKMNTSNKRIVSASVSLIAIASAMKVLVSACKGLSVLSWEELGKGASGLSVLMYVLADFTKRLSDSKKILSSSVSLIAIGTGIKILVSACKSLSSLSWEELGKGVSGLTVLMYVLSDFTKKLSNNNKILKAGTALIAVATGMRILVSACKSLSSLSWEELGKGVSGLTVLMYVLSDFTKKLSNNNKILKASTALIAIGAATNILVSSCKSLAELSIEELIKSLVGVGVLLSEVSMYAKLNKNAKNLISSGVALMEVGAALKIFANVCKELSMLDWEGLGKALLSIGAIFLSAGIFSKMASKNKHMLASGAALIAMAAGLKVFASVCKTFAGMSWEEVVKALITIAGSLVIVGAAGKLLKPVIPSILALSGALTLFGVGFLALGGGLMLIGAGLTSISVGLVSLTTSMSVGATEITAALAIIIAGVANMIPIVVRKIGEGIIEFCKAISEGTPELGKAIKEIVKLLIEVLTDCVPQMVTAFFSLIQNVLDALIENVPEIVKKVMTFLTLMLNAIAQNLPSLIQAGVDVLMAFFVGIFDALNNQDSNVISKALAGVKMFAELLLAITALGVLAAPAMAGVLVIGALVAELTAIFAAIGLLEQIPGIDWLIGEGGKLLGAIGGAIGNFVGGLMGSAMEGISSKLPKIGENLADFMKNAKPFISGISKFKRSSLDGVRALAEIVVILTATDILDGLTSWFSGGSSLVKFGEELAEFGPSLNSYYNSVKDVKDTVVTASANAALSLAELAHKLPKHDGLIQWFFGDATLTSFAKELENFGPAMAKYSSYVKNVNPDAVVGSANAALSLAELAKSLPKHEGVTQWFMGDATLTTFAKELEDFAPAIAKYSEGVKNIKPEAVTASANAALSLAKLADNLPNHGGIVNWFVGDATLTTFAKELESFGPAIANYSRSVSDIDEGKISSSANAASVLSQAAANLPKHNGIVQVFSGDASLSSFAEELEHFGPAIAKYSDSVKNIDNGKVNASANAALVLAKANDSLPESGGLKQIWTGEKSLSIFAEELTKLGPSIKKYSESIEGINSDDITVSANAIKVLAEANRNIPEAGGLKDIFTGNSSLLRFAEGLVKLGPSIKVYSRSVNGINQDSVMTSANAIKMIADANEKIPESGGIKQFWSGEKSLLEFGKALSPLAAHIKNYSDKVSNIEPDAMTKSANFLNVIAGVYEALPNVGGIASWFSGNKASLKDFGDGLADLAKGISRFYSYMYTFGSNGGNFGILDKAVDAAERIAKLGLTLQEINLGVFGQFGDSMAKMANDGITKFISSFKTAEKDAANAAQQFVSSFSDSLKRSTDITGALNLAMTTLIFFMEKKMEDSRESWTKHGRALADSLKNGIASKAREVSQPMENIMKQLQNTAKRYENSMNTSGQKMMVGLYNGLRQKQADIQHLSDTIVTVWIVPFIQKRYKDLYNAGTYLIKGFSLGISDNSAQITAAAAFVASAAVKSIRSVLGIHSPSKEGYRLGDYFGMGFINAIYDSQLGLYNASGKMADSAKSGLSDAIRNIHDYINGNVNTDITIRPVLDLSQMVNDVDNMNRMISLDHSIRLASETGTSFHASSASFRESNFSSRDIVNEIISLRKEVAALNGVIENMKVVMDTGALVGSIASPINRALGQQMIFDRRRN